MNSQYPAGCAQSAVDLSCNGDTDEPNELDELTTLDCGHSGTIRNAEEAAGQLICEPCFIERKNLITSLIGGLEQLAR
jgi:hypothetical protein